jgi:hypothetical protein
MKTLDHSSIKWTYVTHLVDRAAAACVRPLTGEEQAGAVVLGRVLTIGKHREIEDTGGLKRMLFPGDLVAGVLGHRYATDQYEGLAVARGASGHLLSIGGVCGEVVTRNARMVDPTQLEWVGAFTDDSGRPLTMRQFAIAPPRPSGASRPRTLLSVGSSMNSGKTTTAAQMIRSLSGEGHRVAAAKITGTACRKDPGIMMDAGAVRVLDFTHCGYPSTSRCTEEELLSIAADLRSALLAERPDHIVYEIADGVLQRETRLLLENAQFRSTIDAVTFSGVDSISCEGGVRYLRSLGLRVVAAAGFVANSELGMQEVRTLTGLPCLNGEMMLNGAFRKTLAIACAA